MQKAENAYEKVEFAFEKAKHRVNIAQLNAEAAGSTSDQYSLQHPVRISHAGCIP